MVGMEEKKFDPSQLNVYLFPLNEWKPGNDMNGMYDYVVEKKILNYGDEKLLVLKEHNVYNPRKNLGVERKEHDWYYVLGFLRDSKVKPIDDNGHKVIPVEILSKNKMVAVEDFVRKSLNIGDEKIFFYKGQERAYFKPSY